MTNSKYGTQPLYVLDGKIMDNPSFENIPPETIESVNVLKNESATKLYGEKGKNGVVLITSKKDKTAIGNKNEEVQVIGYGKIQNENQNNQPNSGFKIRSSGEDIPLIVKDGIISPNQKMEDINPNDIESINVLKGESAISKYGEKGKNGVLEMTMKKTGRCFYHG